MPTCVKNNCDGASASVRTPTFKDLDEIMIYDVRSSEAWWNADNKHKEREAIMMWTGRSGKWKAANRESPDLMICAAHFMASQLKSGRRISGQMPHKYPIPVGHDLSTPLPDVRPPRTEEVKAARRAEAEAASDSRRQKALALAAARADREEELRMAVHAQDMEARLGAEVDWVVAEISRLGPEAVKKILIEKSLLENEVAATTAEKDRAQALLRKQAHRIKSLSKKVRNIKVIAQTQAARLKEQRHKIKALHKKYEKGKLDFDRLELALLSEQKKGARLLEYDYIMATPGWAQALTGFTRPQLTKLMGDLEKDNYLERESSARSKPAPERLSLAHTSLPRISS